MEKPASDRSDVKRVAILTVGLVVVFAVFRMAFGRIDKSRLYAEGVAAAEAGQWAEAFMSFQRLVKADPSYLGAQAGLDEALPHAIEVLPGGDDLLAEIALVRYLADTGDDEQLAGVLDRCVVSIPAGEFLMGSDGDHPDERPQRTVTLDAYSIDRYEVTNAQYQRFIKETGGEAPAYWSGETYPPGQGDYPVVGVGWANADAYCAWINRRLPTEAEWERACRGSGGLIYPWGNYWDSNRANVDLTVKKSQAESGPTAWDDAWPLLQVTPSAGALGLRPVGSYVDGASPDGLLDLVGNASEWVMDWYNGDGYQDLPDRNPVGLGPPWNHVQRGSSWYEPYGDPAAARDWTRCAARTSAHVSSNPRTGFRCASPAP
jgi:sulfatase modifying factor 1